MRSERELLEEFYKEFGDRVSDHALLRNEGSRFSIIDVPMGAMLIIDDAELGSFFINKLLELEVKIYENLRDIPGWGAKKREYPPVMHPQLKELIEKMNSKKKKK